jgi:hypothetical protein
MTEKSKAKSTIFEAVHETTSDLHRLCFIGKRKMAKFDRLCLEPIVPYDDAQLDTAVAAACGWGDYKAYMQDDEILRRLLALNLERSTPAED